MLKFCRFAILVLIVVWLGAALTLTFFVAPSLFGDWSGVVPNSTHAADILSPLFGAMDRTAFVVFPLAIAIHFALLRLVAPRVRRAVVVSIVLLALTLGATAASSFYLTPQMHQIREDLKVEYGGYHLAPKENPQRARFGALHGISQSLALASMLLCFGSVFCVTQLMESSAGASGEAPRSAVIPTGGGGSGSGRP